MAKVKNTGGQPRGFFTEDGGHVTVAPGEEKEFNMTEADFKNLQQSLENMDDPKPYELSGSHGGVKADKKKKGEDEVEMPAQSSEPPVPTASPVVTPTPTTPKAPVSKKSDDDDDRKPAAPPQRGR
jgi:hypothetical protein